MDSPGQYEQQVVWTVVGTDIGPLLLAATRDGLVNVVFHATDATRDRALERLAARLGTEPVEAPVHRCWPRRYARWRRTSRAGGATSTCRWTGR
ncbi:hypothetical protein SALBM311S_11131 [Streptomyces alboniger]